MKSSFSSSLQSSRTLQGSPRQGNSEEEIAGRGTEISDYSSLGLRERLGGREKKKGRGRPGEREIERNMEEKEKKKERRGKEIGKRKVRRE